MKFRVDPKLALRWQRLAERQREHLLSMRGNTTVDETDLATRLDGAERNIAAWGTLAGHKDAAEG